MFINLNESNKTKKLIVISNPEPLKGETEAVVRMFEYGLEYFHLRRRMKNNDFEEFIKAIPEKFHPNIIIHTDYGLAEKFNLGGIHLKEENDSINSEFCKSISCHGIKEILNLKGKYKYVFLSPLFDSISKKGYKSNFDISGIRKKIMDIDQTVIALGGIKAENASLTLNSGFEGIAVLGYLWQNFVSSDKLLPRFLKLKEFTDN